MMKRQEAEKLLAALIFDDLDERSKADLQAYLETDDELRERLADMRMAVKVASDTIAQGPEPTLSDRRLKRLAKLAKHQSRGRRIITLGRLAVAAAVVLAAAALFAPTLHRARMQRRSYSPMIQHLDGGTSEYYKVLAEKNGKRGGAEFVGAPTRVVGMDESNEPVSREGLAGKDRGTELSAVVARSASRRTHVSDGDSFQRLREQSGGSAGRYVEHFGASRSTAPAGQLADAKKPAPPAEPKSVLNYDAMSLDSQVVTNEPVVVIEGKPVVSSSDSPKTVSHNTTVTYEWRGNIEPTGGSTTLSSKGVTSEVSPIKRNRNERGEELAKSSESEVADREATAYGVSSYADARVGGPRPEAESKSERSWSRADISDRSEPAKRLKQISAVSGPEPDVEQEARDELAELKTKLSPVARPQDAADKYDADRALPEGARFKVVPVNPWVMTDRDALSTFALNVDTASYTLCRRYIQNGFLPPIGAVRMEEFINYFDYQYPQRSAPTFAVHAEAAPSPFAGQDKNLTLLKIGIKARTVGRDQQKPAHLVFVIDASASMGQADRLPLVQEALGLLVDKLSPADRVSLITCASQGRLHLEAVSAGQRDKIHQTIDAIQPAGPTNLLAGLKLGYALARKAFAPNQINHVVLCSDGVANVGQTEAESVLQAVAEDRKQGITLTCIGVGYGTYNDAFLETLANQGDGSYLFLDSPQQARETFVEKFSAALQVVTKDARIQVSFNPQRVRRYRLIGYENRDIEDARFRDDTVDAGEVGSGQCSTALYELELIGQPSTDGTGDLGTVYVRYRDVDTGQMEEISSRLTDQMIDRPTVQNNPRFFLAAVAARFAEWLRQSEHAKDANLSDTLATAEQVSLALPLDRDVRELAELIRKSEHLPRAP